MFGGMFVGIGENPSRDAPNGSPELVVMGYVLTFLGIVALPICAKMAKSIQDEKMKKLEAERARVEKENQEEQEKQLAIVIYKKCRQKNVAESDDGLKLIAGTYGVDSIQKAKEYYLRGKSLVEAQEAEEKAKKLEEIRNDEKAEVEQNLKLANVKGKKKYTEKLEVDYLYGTKALEIGEILKDRARNEMHYTARKQDWATAGGFASAIAGGAAGLAVASDVQRQNAEAEIEAEKIRQDAHQNLKNVQSMERDLTPVLNMEKSIIDTINDKIYDESNLYEKFSLLEFSKLKVKVLKSQNLEVEGVVKAPTQLELLGSKAVLDGSIKVEVKNPKGEIIAVGYYAAPGFNETDLSKVGFENVKKFRTTCIVDDYSKIPQDEYICNIVPINMWMIEC